MNIHQIFNSEKARKMQISLIFAPAGHPLLSKMETQNSIFIMRRWGNYISTYFFTHHMNHTCPQSILFSKQDCRKQFRMHSFIFENRQILQTKALYYEVIFLWQPSVIIMLRSRFGYIFPSRSAEPWVRPGARVTNSGMRKSSAIMCWFGLDVRPFCSRH